MFVVNYKGLHQKSVSTAPELSDLLGDLYVNSTICFPGHDEDDMESEEEFVARIVGYLHSDAEPRSSRSSASSRSSGTPSFKRTKRGFHVRGVEFRTTKRDHLHVLKNRWELFVLLDKKGVEASCLVQFDDIYQTCEIHEVCVATPGKGLCKKLLSHVRDSVRGSVREIRIFCERGNPGACRCYDHVFKGGQIIHTPATTGFVFSTRE